MAGIVARDRQSGNGEQARDIAGTAATDNRHGLQGIHALLLESCEAEIADKSYLSSVNDSGA